MAQPGEYRCLSSKHFKPIQMGWSSVDPGQRKPPQSHQDQGVAWAQKGAGTAHPREGWELREDSSKSWGCCSLQRLPDPLPGPQFCLHPHWALARCRPGSPYVPLAPRGRRRSKWKQPGRFGTQRPKCTKPKPEDGVHERGIF